MPVIYLAGIEKKFSARGSGASVSYGVVDPRVGISIWHSLLVKY
jgi:hypothetical protein